MKTKVAILIVAYNGIDYLGDCLRSVFQSNRDLIELVVFVVDNASADGSGQWVRENFPECHVYFSDRNLGFTGANNLALEKSKEQGEFDFVYLLNQDTEVDTDFLTAAVDYSREHPQAGAIQSLIMLHPETELVNTSGNQLHYLGFGLLKDYRRRTDEIKNEGVIGYPSGAGVLIRTDILDRIGLFSDIMFLYLEDADLGIRLHLIGQPPHVCRQSLVFHKYEFSSTLAAYQYLERNRYWILLVHYRWATLLLLFPAIAAMELGQWIFALQNGIGSKKWEAFSGLFAVDFRAEIRAARKFIQTQRSLSDRELLSRMIPTIQTEQLSSVLLDRIGNPILGCYYYLVSRILFW